MRQIWVLLGVLTGFTLATAVAVRVDSPSPILRPVVAFFGMLGFIFGNVHQGSDLSSVSAVYVVFTLGGGFVGYLCARVFGRRRPFEKAK